MNFDATASVVAKPCPESNMSSKNQFFTASLKSGITEHHLSSNVKGRTSISKSGSTGNLRLSRAAALELAANILYLLTNPESTKKGSEVIVLSIKPPDEEGYGQANILGRRKRAPRQ
jgi:hypothetical protein